MLLGMQHHILRGQASWPEPNRCARWSPCQEGNQGVALPNLDIEAGVAGVYSSQALIAPAGFGSPQQLNASTSIDVSLTCLQIVECHSQIIVTNICSVWLPGPVGAVA